MKKCLVIGSAMLDIVIHLDHLPKRGEDVYAKTRIMTLGGCALNVADILKHSNTPYTLLAPIGNGTYGNFVAEQLVFSGHNSPLISNKGDNGYCISLVEPDGERSFITSPGIESYFEYEWFEFINPKDYDSVYVCGYELEDSDAIIRFCENNPHLSIYYAPGPRIMNINEHKRLFALQPILHLNSKEALAYTKCSNPMDAADVLFSETNNTVIITLGSEGCYYKSNDSEGLIYGNVVDALDSTGAGDAHLGAFIANQYSGKDVTTSIENSNKIAAALTLVEGSTLTAEEFLNIN